MRAIVSGVALMPLRKMLPPRRPSVLRKAMASISVVLPAGGKEGGCSGSGGRLWDSPTRPPPAAPAPEAPMRAVSEPGRHQPDTPRSSGRTSLDLSVTVYVI